MPWGNDGIEKVKIKKIQDLYVCLDFLIFTFILSLMQYFRHLSVYNIVIRV